VAGLLSHLRWEGPRHNLWVTYDIVWVEFDPITGEETSATVVGFYKRSGSTLEVQILGHRVTEDEFQFTGQHVSHWELDA